MEWTKSLQNCVSTSTQLENEVKVTQNQLNVAKPLVTKVIAYIIKEEAKFEKGENKTKSLKKLIKNLENVVEATL